MGTARRTSRWTSRWTNAGRAAAVATAVAWLDAIGHVGTGSDGTLAVPSC
jgi:hypothetical protein